MRHKLLLTLLVAVINVMPWPVFFAKSLLAWPVFGISILCTILAIMLESRTGFLLWFTCAACVLFSAVISYGQAKIDPLASGYALVFVMAGTLIMVFLPFLASVAFLRWPDLLKGRLRSLAWRFVICCAALEPLVFLAAKHL